MLLASQKEDSCRLIAANFQKSGGLSLPFFLIKSFGKYGPERSKIKADEKRLWKEVKKSAFDEKKPVEGTTSSLTNRRLYG